MSDDRIVWCRTPEAAKRAWRRASLEAVYLDLQKRYPTVLVNYMILCDTMREAPEAWRQLVGEPAAPDGPGVHALKYILDRKIAQFADGSSWTFKDVPLIDGKFLRHGNTAFIVGDGSMYAGLPDSLVLPLVMPDWEHIDYDTEEVQT